MKELFFEFVESPSRDTYLAIREVIISADTYDPYSNELEEADKLLETGKLEAAREVIVASMANLLLSPRAHLTLAYIVDEAGDEQGAKMEGYVAAACCEGILATGTGTKDEPYSVVRTSDEYDLLHYTEKEFQNQSLIHEDEQHFDVIECADESEIWFDITDCYNRLEELFRQRSQED